MARKGTLNKENWNSWNPTNWII